MILQNKMYLLLTYPLTGGIFPGRARPLGEVVRTYTSLRKGHGFESCAFLYHGKLRQGARLKGKGLPSRSGR
jgi:hypothetical protein